MENNGQGKKTRHELRACDQSQHRRSLLQDNGGNGEWTNKWQVIPVQKYYT